MPIYTPIESEISFTVAVVQAATLLDEAALAAVHSGKVNDMIKVAAGWMELGVNMLQRPTEEEEVEEGDEHDITSETTIMGFGSPASRESAEQEYEDRNR